MLGKHGILPYFQVSFFAKDVSSQGFSEDCWGIIPCIIPHVSQQNVSIQYAFNSIHIVLNPFKTYPFKVYPFNTYASAGMAMNVNKKHFLAYHCISRNGNEYEIIAGHFKSS